MKSILKKIIKPENCILTIAPPLTEEAFYNDLKNDKKKRIC